MAEDQNFSGKRLPKDAVGPPLNIDVFDFLHRLGVKHPDFRTAGKTVMGGGVHRYAMATDICNRADVLVGIEAEHDGVAAARYIDFPAIVIGIDIVNTARTHKLGCV